MTLFTLIFAAAIALCLGVMAAVLLRVGGLVLIVVAMACLFGFRLITGSASPDLVESALLICAVQAGYLMCALTPLADFIRKPPAPSLSVKPRDDAE